MSDFITRAEAEAMIQAALAGRAGKGRTDEVGFDKRSAYFGPSGYGETQAEVTGVAMGKVVERQSEIERIGKVKVAEQKPENPRNERQRISYPIGQNRAADIAPGLGLATGSRGTGSRGRPAEPVPVESEKKAAPVGIAPESMDAAANIVAAVILQLSAEFVTRSEFDGIPPEIRTMGLAPEQNAQGGGGDSVLGLQGTDPRTAGWMPMEAIGSLDYDFVVVGNRKLTVPARTTNFLKIYLNGTTAPEWVAAMPETMDSDSVVIDVTKNRIYLHGNFA